MKKEKSLLSTLFELNLKYKTVEISLVANNNEIKNNEPQRSGN